MATNYYREDKFLKAFGYNLRTVREKMNITQEQLANMCDLPPSQVGRIERGEINTSISHVYLIASKLNIHPKELWDFKI